VVCFWIVHTPGSVCAVILEDAYSIASRKREVKSRVVAGSAAEVIVFIVDTGDTGRLREV
jgi:hypothetical protein